MQIPRRFGSYAVLTETFICYVFMPVLTFSSKAFFGIRLDIKL